MNTKKIVSIFISIVFIINLILPSVQAIETKEIIKNEEEQIEETTENKENEIETNKETTNENEGIGIEEQQEKETDNKIRTMQAVQPISIPKQNRTISDGIYEIKSNIGTNMYLDIHGASTENEANVEVFEKNNNDNQKYKVTYSNGYYTITSVHSKKSLDVYDNGKRDGTNVQQYTLGENSDNQKWVIKEAGNGKYNIISKSSGSYLNVDEENKNVQIYSSSGEGRSNEKFEFEKVLDDENSCYEIETAMNSNMCLDIAGASKENGANVQIWDKGNTEANNQKFEFTRTNDGYYTIKALHSGNVLDVYGNYKTNGTKVEQFQSNNQDNQKWTIKAVGNDYYNIISKSSELCMDIHGASTEKGTNVEIFQTNEGANQKFKLNKLGKIETPPKVDTQPTPPAGQEEQQKLTEGVYKIKSAVNDNMVFDIDMSNSGYETGANLQMYADCNAKNQKFYVKDLGNGYYTIKAIHSKQVLDVFGAYKENGTNVTQFTETNSDNQQWKIKSAGNGYYNIISKCNDLYLDIYGGNVVNMANVQMFQSNGETWQKFRFEPTEYQEIDEGTYEIQTYTNTDLLIDIAGASLADGAKAQLWQRGDTEDVKNQRFKVTYDSNTKEYTMTVERSGKALDVPAATGSVGTAIQQYTPNNDSKAQKWKIVDLQDGTYNIVSQCGGYYLDVQGSNVVKGAQIQLNNKNGKDSQRFKFVKPGSGGKYPDIENAIEQIKRNHPKWEIKLNYTGLDWNDVLNNEDAFSGGSPKSLSYETYKGEWKASDVKYDNGHWYQASRKAIAYMMDPRNSLDADGSWLFQFQDLTNSTGSREDIRVMVQGTYLNNDSLINTIMSAAQTYNINPLHLVARMLLEQGRNGSGALNGHCQRNGRPVYNLFNIKASGRNESEVINNGADYAASRGWYSAESSIMGGAEFLAKDYISKGQSTLYYQKYNVVRNPLYAHQYMQNIRAANDEGNSIYHAYKDIGILDNHFTFVIPVYENMPAAACPRPVS